MRHLGISTCAAATSAIAYACYRYILWMKEMNLIPGPEVGNFFTGNQEDIMRAGGFAPFIVSLHETYGSVVRYWEGPLNVCISISDPEILRDLEIQKWEKRVEGLNFMKGLFGSTGIAFLTGSAAKKRRNLIFQIFGRQPFEALLPVWIRSIQTSLDQWYEKGSKSKSKDSFLLDVQKEVQPIWANLNQYNVFGDDIGTSRICSLFSDATNLLVRIRYTFSWLSILGIGVLPFSSLWWEVRALLRGVHAEMDRLIDLRLHPSDSHSASSRTDSDLLTLLLREPHLSRREVHDETLTLLFGAFENASIMSNALYQLACHPDIQDRARAEARAALAPQPQAPHAAAAADADEHARPAAALSTLGDLRGLRLLRAVLSESLRLVPTGVMTWRVCPSARVATDPATGARYALPRGAVVVVPMIAVHRHPRAWPAPGDFRPDRFLAAAAAAGADGGGDVGAGLPPLQFIPFGFGTRACLGQRYAMAAASLVLSLVLDRFRVRLPAAGDSEPPAAGGGGGGGEAPVVFQEKNFT